MKGEIVEADQFSISRKCKQCGKEFKTEHMLNTICSDECRKVRRRASINEYNKHYQKTPKYKEIAKDHTKRPEPNQAIRKNIVSTIVSGRKRTNWPSVSI